MSPKWQFATEADSMNALAVACAGSPERIGSGRALIDAEACQYADEVLPSDKVLADFGSRNVHTGGSLYLVEAIENAQVTWCGCCRMIRVPQGIAIDQDGRGGWTTVSSLDDIGWRIAGRVESVLRPRCLIPLQMAAVTLSHA